MGEEKLQDIINKLKVLPKFVSSEIDNIIEENAPHFQISARTNLEGGVDGDGDKLKYQKPRLGKSGSNGYSIPYTKYKSKLGGETGFVNLKLSGEYHSSIELERVEKNSFLFTSNDDKAIFLEANYGDHLGIQDDNLQKITDDRLEPELNESIEKYLR